jgi:hypothetical protein
VLLRDARARGCGGDGAMKRGASGSGATGHRQTSELPQALNLEYLQMEACDVRSMDGSHVISVYGYIEYHRVTSTNTSIHRGFVSHNVRVKSRMVSLTVLE